MKIGTNGRAALVASAVAGLLVTTGVATSAAAGDGDTVRCYGVNKCKGTGDCGGKGHSCAGENACKGKGYLNLDKDTCLKIEGGRLTADPDKTSN